MNIDKNLKKYYNDSILQCFYIKVLFIMKELKIVREPGFIYDLIYIFVLRFNKEHCLSKHINYQKANEDTEFFNKIYNEYKDISGELLPFFYSSGEDACLITEYYFATHLDEFEFGYSFTKLYKELSDVDKLRINVIKYYFPDFSMELCNDESFIGLINNSIRNSKYSDSLKSALYSFFIDPDSIIKILLDELLTIHASLRQKYETFGEKLFEFQSDFNLEFLLSKLGDNNTVTLDVQGFDKYLVCPCIYRKNCINVYFSNDLVIILLGYDYIHHMEYLLSQNYVPNLDTFGNAIAERNRVEILDLMLNNNEITIKDLEQILNLTGTNAYYHLSLMIKANIVKARNKGRTVYYSINKEYFTSVLKFLQRYI